MEKDENFDHLFDEEQRALTEDKLTQLSNLCFLYEELEKSIENLELQVKNKKAELEQVSRTHIPNILNAVGLSEVKLANGKKVIIEDKIHANIADKNYLLAYKSMIQAEGGDENAERMIDELFKSQAIIENAEDELLEYFIENEIPYNMKRTIHWQTLNKYCKGKLEQGKEIPEGISAFQYQETKIK